MTVSCPGCQRAITVPPDKVGVPNLRAKCRCGQVFLVAEASRADSPAIPTPSLPPAIPSAPPAVAPPTASARTAPVPAAVPPPVPVAVEKPRPAAPASATATPPPVPARPATTSQSINWRRCQDHRQAKSDHVCPACLKGYCAACVKTVQNAAICPACDGLCVASADYETVQERARQRDRSMLDDLGLIATYPFRDRWAFGLLALFTWFFGLMRTFSGFAFLLSQGVLVWYSFYALSKVAVGNFRDFMPDFSDISDLARPARLSLAALIISAGPFFLVALFMPGPSLPFAGRGAPASALPTVRAQEPPSPAAEETASPDAEGRDALEHELELAPEPPSVLSLALLAVTGLWMIVYMPVALTVAALSSSFLSTLNPLIGIDTIRKMGSVYWQALVIYSVLAVGQWLIGFILGFIPILGGLVKAFVDAYAYLAIGCTLGLAVFKKATALGWD